MVHRRRRLGRDRNAVFGARAEGVGGGRGDELHADAVLECLEHQLDLPAKGVRGADILGGELLDRNVGDVEVVFARAVVADADDSRWKS
jgi:hypothetical protein